MAEIEQEKQRIAERLARVEAERTKLADQLSELEVAERVLMRFGGGGIAPTRPLGGPARTATSARGRRRGASGKAAKSLTVSDATLVAVKAHPQGMEAADILRYLAREFGMTVRPNHLGVTLQRHRRAGRLEFRESRWCDLAGDPTTKS
jgi:hypothetical protein